MTGKLLGTVGGSLTILSVYLLGTILAAQAKGLWTSVPWDLLPWFLLFQILGVLFFAAIFMAVGSAVSQLKEAQSMLLPVWLLMMIPMFVWFQIVREPNGPLAMGLSWLPPATPSTMLLRMATGVTIPLWQIVGTLIMLLVTTALCVVVAGRIFRVGILWQGKTPKLAEIIRWGLARSI
jgi:ABC-2 type transport system permease protein